MDIQRLTKTARELVAVLHDDLEAKLDDAERERIRLLWDAMRDRGRTAEPVEAWQSLYLEQVAVAWVITTLFVRFLEDKGLIADRWIAGEGAALYDAKERQDAYFEEHPTNSDADYLLHVFNELGDYDAGAVFRPDRNPLHRVRISGDAAHKLIGALRAVDTDDEGNERLVFGFGAVSLDPYGEDPSGAQLDSAASTQSATYARNSSDAGRLNSGEQTNQPGLNSSRESTKKYDTRFLGDLYEQISDDVRDLYALCQTPDFVESFILDHTLTPAIKTFGADNVHLIDPTCGSGHFLLGGFHRLVKLRRDAHPAETPRAQIAHVLARVAGVDINPFAAVITRFRLLIAVLEELNSGRAKPLQLHDVPAFDFRVATGDALLLGKSESQSELGLSSSEYAIPADLEQALDESVLAEEILRARYHAVVGNPPYKVVSDPAQNKTYRALYPIACHRQYQLGSPFFVRFHQLAVDEQDGGGFVGQITSNAFTKREFGVPLVEKIFPSLDLTHIIDTSGAYIPGHGTPTVILFSRNRQPQSDTLTAILGIRGEPETPRIPSEGLVWREILQGMHETGFRGEFVSSGQYKNDMMKTHPVPMKGGYAIDVFRKLNSPDVVLSDVLSEIGRTGVTGSDSTFKLGTYVIRRMTNNPDIRVSLVEGKQVRDYSVTNATATLWPYDRNFEPIKLEAEPFLAKTLWSKRYFLSTRKAFGKRLGERGQKWFEWTELYDSRLRTPLSITFAFVATHNHFVLDRGGKVFKRTAPVIKLAEDASVDDHLALLGPLNSSTFGFWARMVFFEKGYSAEVWQDRLEHDSTKLQKFPLPNNLPTELARRLDALAQELAEHEPAAVATREVPTQEALDAAKAEWTRIRGQMIALQEELDFACYEAYGLADDVPLVGSPAPSDPGTLDSLPDVRLGERPFEIVMARLVEAGELNTEWFRRHRSKAITEIPKRYPEWYKHIVQQRLDLIEQNKFVRLIEAPEYKRRWQTDTWKKRVSAALEDWLRDRLETPRYLPWTDREHCTTPPTMISIRELCDKSVRDDDFMSVGALYKGEAGFDYEKLVKDLVLSDSVPALPRDRFKKSGLKKYARWEVTWDKQREEDRIDARHVLPTSHDDYLDVGAVTKLKKALKIKKPPTYNKADFISKSNAYDLRGKLDVPKERYTLHLGADLESDGGAVISWAGFDHKQRAESVIQRIGRLQNEEGWTGEQLVPLLAELEDLLPWLNQWHTEIDPNFGTSFAEAATTRYTGLLTQLGYSRSDIDAYRLGGSG